MHHKCQRKYLNERVRQVLFCPLTLTHYFLVVYSNIKCFAGGFLFRGLLYGGILEFLEWIICKNASFINITVMML